MQTHSASHSESSAKYSVCHVRSIDVMKIVASHENECLQSFQLPAAESVDPKLIFGIVVESDVAVIIRLIGNNAPHGEDHIEQC